MFPVARNLEDYIHAPNSIDPLIKLALIHYQFEASIPLRTAMEEPAAS